MARKDVLPITGGGTGKKVAGLLFLAALFAFVVRNPAEAAEAAKGIGTFAVSIIDGIASFIRQVA